jgi:hypothetical protein
VFAMQLVRHSTAEWKGEQSAYTHTFSMLCSCREPDEKHKPYFTVSHYGCSHVNIFKKGSDAVETEKSKVAQLMQQIALQEEAARRGLTGFAIVATHESITKRMELGAERILRLITEGKHDEAVALMNTETWGVEVEEEADLLETRAE